MTQTEQLRSKPCPACHVCGADGTVLYENLYDYLFNVPGSWNLRKCQNHMCGLIWLDPMPLPEELGKAYRTYYTHQDGYYSEEKQSASLLRKIYERIKLGYRAYKYGYQHQSSTRLDRLLGRLLLIFPTRREHLDYGFAQLKNLQKGRLLEIGCGSGKMLAKLANWGWNAEGIDFDENAVRNARNKNLTVHQGDLAFRKYIENSFDAIYCSHVLEHVPDPKAFLRECYRILKPGGGLVVFTPNSESWGHSIFESDWRGLEPPRHLHIFTKGAFGAIAEASGFRKYEIDTTSCGTAGMLLSSLEIRQLKKRVSKSSWNLSMIVFSELVHFYQWFRVKHHLSFGEEIVAILIK